MQLSILHIRGEKSFQNHTVTWEEMSQTRWNLEEIILIVLEDSKIVTYGQTIRFFLGCWKSKNFDTTQRGFLEQFKVFHKICIKFEQPFKSRLDSAEKCLIFQFFLQPVVNMRQKEGIWGVLEWNSQLLFWPCVLCVCVYIQGNTGEVRIDQSNNSLPMCEIDLNVYGTTST